jgi:hypothetical protein
MDDKSSESHAMCTESKEKPDVLASLKRLSSWSKMKRVVALCLNIKRVAAGLLKPHQLSPAELQAAEDVIVKIVQTQSFSQDMELLSAESPVLRTSSLAKLDPFLDQQGILRVGGRLKSSSLPYHIKHPALLPKDHPVTNAILHYFHRKTAHQGRSTTLHEARNHGFWIVNAGHAIGKIVANCVVCRKKRGLTSVQKMSDLPTDRLERCPPFTNVGADFFGPFIVKEGRKELKRWGCIFTCLYSRAIHLEVATTLSTDGFINVLRRFISLRGAVKKLRSDQGTNFVGANNELKAALNEMDCAKVKRYLADQGCEFVFNPANASHMGGVWERPIRTVRSVLSSLLRDLGSQLDDDSLRTLMAEAAAIVNSRPLSVDNLNDPKDPIPISPNHLLTQKTSVVVPPPGDFQRTDVYSRKRW